MQIVSNSSAQDFALAAKSVKQRSGRDASSHHEVVLHGLMPVTGSRRLNCYDCDTELLKYVADYRINLIAPAGLTDREIDEFQTGMREIMRYIKYSNDREMLDKILNTEQRFKNVERSAAEIINAATNSKIKIDQGKETVDMCLAIQEMREESRIEGRNEGRIEGIHVFIQDKIEDGVQENTIVDKLQRHFALDEETARRYYREYAQ